MRIVFATLALTASMLSLAACSEPAEDTAATTAEADPAAMEPATAEAPADAAFRRELVERAIKRGDDLRRRREAPLPVLFEASPLRL